MWQPKKLTIQQKEERRLAAAQLLQEGQLSQAEIARQFDVSPMAVCKWAKQVEQAGVGALCSRPKAGRPPYLTEQQWQQVLEQLRQGAQAAGFATERWTLQRIRSLICQQFSVHYNAHYLAERLRALGWSPQKPVVYARERSDELVEAWLKGDWPRIQQRLANCKRR